MPWRWSILKQNLRRRVGASFRLTFYGIILWVSAHHTRSEIHNADITHSKYPQPREPMRTTRLYRKFRSHGRATFAAAAVVGFASVASFVPYRGTAANRILGALFHTIMSVSCISAYAQGRLEAQYGITMTGVPIGHIAWHVDIGDDVYVTSANGKASGVLSLLINGEGSIATSGRIVNGQMTPTKFTSNIIDEFGKTELQVTFAAGVAERSIIQEPAKKHKLLPVNDDDRRGVTDPLSALLIPTNTRAGVLESANCHRVLLIFDGQRRYNLVLAYRRLEKVNIERGYSGPVLVCGAILQPIGGYRADSMVVKYIAGRRDIELWFAPIAGTSIMAPIGVLIPTLIGALRIGAEEFKAVAASASPVPSIESPR